MGSMMKKVAMVGALSLALAGTALAPQAANAQSGVRVLVMGEDSNPDTVVRSSDIFRRVISAMKEQMGRGSIRIIDEVDLAFKHGWKVSDRLPKAGLIEAANLADPRPRVLMSFRIHVTRENLDLATKLKTRIFAEMTDIHTGQYLGAYDPKAKTYSAPADCNRLCITETVGAHASEIAADLGYVMRQKLEYLTAGKPGGAAENSDNADYSMATSYDVTLKNFDAPDAIALEQVMAKEFPGYASHDVFEKTPTRVRLDYVSTAKSSKLQEWLQILLMDMGHTPGKHVLVTVNGTDITVDKIVGAPLRRPAGATRFN